MYIVVLLGLLWSWALHAEDCPRPTLLVSLESDAQERVQAGLCQDCPCALESFQGRGAQQRRQVYQEAMRLEVAERFERRVLEHFPEQLKRYGHLSNKCGLDQLPRSLCPNGQASVRRLVEKSLNLTPAQSCLPPLVLEKLHYQSHREQIQEHWEDREMIAKTALDWADRFAASQGLPIESRDALLENPSEAFRDYIGETCEKIFQTIETVSCRPAAPVPTQNSELMVSLFGVPTEETLPREASSKQVDLFLLSCEDRRCSSEEASCVPQEAPQAYNPEELFAELPSLLGNYERDNLTTFQAHLNDYCPLFDCPDFDEALEQVELMGQCSPKKTPPRTLAEVQAGLACGEAEEDFLCLDPTLKKLLEVKLDAVDRPLRFELAELPNQEFDVENARAYLRTQGIPEAYIESLGETGLRASFGQEIVFTETPPDVEVAPQVAEQGRALVQEQREHREVRAEGLAEESRDQVRERRRQVVAEARERRPARRLTAPVTTPVGREERPAFDLPTNEVYADVAEMERELQQMIREAQEAQTEIERQGYQTRIQDLEAQIERGRQSSTDQRVARVANRRRDSQATRLPERLPPARQDFTAPPVRERAAIPSAAQEGMEENTGVEEVRTEGESLRGGGPSRAIASTGPGPSGFNAPGGIGGAQAPYLERTPGQIATILNLEDLDSVELGEPFTLGIREGELLVTLDLIPVRDSEGIRYRVRDEDLVLSERSREALMSSPFFRRYLHPEDYARLTRRSDELYRSRDLNERLERSIN